MVSQVYYDVPFIEKVNYCTYLKKFCFKNLVQSEVLCLKESEQRYYAFLRSDLLTVPGNQMILNYDLMYRQESIWKTKKTTSMKLWRVRPKFIILSFDERLIITLKVPLSSDPFYANMCYNILFGGRVLSII